MKDTREIEKQIQRIKTALAEKRASIQDFETLIGEKVEGELWGFSEKALEKAVWDSFFYLERNKDCLEEEPLTSHRRLVGRVIVLFKKTWRTLFRPYSKMILKRQNRFNRELIQLLLASLLRIEKIKERLDALEAKAEILREKQD